ncbi:MAG: hypothetical protein APF77_04150 [Clostridia bacterium BRH_c25]|nr:MAG: hypothetical protein APF77_04150 [Clostridia bacterium BRH_c25]
MEPTILNEIPFKVNLEQLFTRLKMKQDSEYAERVIELAKEAESIGKPKAIFNTAYIEEKGNDFIVVEGVKFSSRILCANIGDAQKLFPFLATCGAELAEWAKCKEDMLDAFTVDILQQLACKTAGEAVYRKIMKDNGMEHISKMNPGSLADWPLSEQKNLFQLFKGREAQVGIILTDCYLMIPVKSVSGIWFSKEIKFENCQLCQRPDCPSRVSDYSPCTCEK